MEYLCICIDISCETDGKDLISSTCCYS